MDHYDPIEEIFGILVRFKDLDREILIQHTTSNLLRLGIYYDAGSMVDFMLYHLKNNISMFNEEGRILYHE
jgi:hypothetical protein